ncbi:MAG: hypothetical protein IT383_24825 [Deltaproteobacteria bacterium]|nr:hypothetical protein [Deltaproteobacteria bacterium]
MGRRPRQEPVEESDVEPWDAVRTVLLWAARERGRSHAGDVLCIDRLLGMPTDVEGAWAVIAGASIDELTSDLVVPLDELIDELFSALNEAQATAFQRRCLAAHPPTLEDLRGDLGGVTRERVRQIQAKAEQTIDSLMQRRRFRLLRWRAMELRRSLGSSWPADGATEVLSLAVRDVAPSGGPKTISMLLYLAGPYEERGGWWTLRDRDEPSEELLMRRADEHGLIEAADGQEWARSHGLTDEFRDRWLERTGSFRVLDRKIAVWKGSVVDKCVAVLAARGAPMSTETLVDAVGEGHSLRASKTRLFDDRRVVRTAPNEWGLRQWGLEEYSGIAAEIGERIDAAGGRAPMSALVTDLCAQFGVKESSIRVYATAPMFVIEGGMVRRRRADEPFASAGSLGDCGGVFRSGPATFSVVVAVDCDVLRGSGRAIPAALAQALGVGPGDRRSFRGAGYEVVASWPMTAAMPALGSTRGAATCAGAASGDRLRLDFSLETLTVMAERIPSGLDGRSPREVVRLYTSLDQEGDVREHIARAIGSSASALRQRLLARGDLELAAQLPSEAVDQSLAKALDELASALGGQ